MLVVVLGSMLAAVLGSMLVAVLMLVAALGSMLVLLGTALGRKLSLVGNCPWLETVLG